jgi:hypothetical protein
MLAEETLSNSELDGYVLRDISTICSGCSLTFASSCLVSVPPVTEYDNVEADLHRVLPDPSLRAAMISICPDCGYAGWSARFRRSTLNPEILPDPVSIEHSKRFALAVKSARARGMDTLDIAYIALNGLYCVREAGEDDQLWLELAAYEQSRGMAGELLLPLTGQDYLIMAELWRQLRRFDEALTNYDLAAADEDMASELIAHQKMLAVAGNSDPTTLPPYLVRILFPEAAVATANLKMEKNGRPVPPIIRRADPPGRLSGNYGPPDRKNILSSAVPEEPTRTFLAGAEQSVPVLEPSPVPIATANTDPQKESDPAQQQAIASSAGADAAALLATQPSSGPASDAFSTEAIDEAISSINESSIDALFPLDELKEAATDEAVVGTTVEPTAAAAQAGSDDKARVDGAKESVSAWEPEKDSAVADLPAEPTVALARVSQNIAVPQSGSSVSLVQASQVNVTSTHSTFDNSPNRGARAQKIAERQQLSAGEPPDASPFVAPSSPDVAPRPASPARTRRGKTVKSEEDEARDKFPEIQITDEEAAEYNYGYGYQGYSGGNSGYLADDGSEDATISYDESNTSDSAIAPQYEDADDDESDDSFAVTNGSDYQSGNANQQPASATSSAAAETKGTDAESDGDYTDAVAKVEGFLSLTRLPSYQSWIRGYRK